MEGAIVERLDLMSAKVQEKLTVCQQILTDIEEGSPCTKQHEIQANRLRSHYHGFVSEIQILLQSRPPDDDLPENLTAKLREYTALQLEASEVLADFDIYLSPTTETPILQPPSEANPSRLPKLDIPKFDGNILHWHAFWDKFTSNIVNKSLSDVDKFSYLEQALEGEAARAIGGLDTTNANYSIAVERLKERFAKPGILKDSHYVALQQIPRASSDVAECRKVMDEIERHLQVLKSLGEDTNHTGLRSTILDKFPMEVLHDLRQYTKSDDESVDEIRGYLKQVIATREDFSRREAIKTMGQASTSGFTTESFFSRESKPQRQQQKSRKQDQRNKPKNKRETNNTQAQNSNFSGTTTNVNKRRSSENQSQSSTPPSKKPTKSCFFCSKPHFTDTCLEYPTLETRKAHLKNRCYQCFSNKHLTNSCDHKMKCGNCGVFGAHNRALCPKAIARLPKAKETTTVNFSQFRNSAILQTAEAPITGPSHLTLTGRILFDTGSEKSYISQSLVKRLKLEPLEQTSLTIYTFGNKRPKTVDTTLVDFSIHTLHSKVDVSAFSVPTTTNQIPAYPDLKRLLEKYFPGLPIAKDVSRDSPADIIIGSDFYYQFMKPERKEVEPNLFLINSEFGWILTGALTTSREKIHDQQLSFLTYIDGGHSKHRAVPTPPDPPFQQDSIRGLWELETIGITDSPKVLQDEEIIQYFNQTTIFKDGRYYVKWPWVQYPPELLANFGMSLGRLKSLLKRLDVSTLQKYDAVFQDQLQKGVIETVQESPIPNNHPVHYLPHHCVIQEHKSTKLRVVYDASAKVQGHCSLNDCLYKGPLMLEDLTTLLLNFRTHRIALTADIEKAFLQVGLQNEDRDVTRFLWLKDLSKPPTADNLLHLRFCRVPFGVISSPFLLAATIRLHLQRQNSALSERLSTCLYVDNLITGAESEKEAIDLYLEARHRFEELSMNIREWCSNSSKVLEQIPPELKSLQTPTTVLGMKWDQQSDKLMLSVKETLFTEPVNTKRHVSHIVASIFDPCGLVIPITLGAKLFLQSLWVDRVKWDTRLPEHRLEEWKDHADGLRSTLLVSLPRLYWSTLPANETLSSLTFELHCFTDASREAYAAAVYLRVSTGVHSPTSLTMARLRLTPIRHRDSFTIPKLELMAVLIGVRLLAYVQKGLDLPLTHTFLWTDSQIVLGWLKSDRLLPPFVTRRISEIKKSPSTQFRYVPTSENPADIATRGVTYSCLPSMWFDGPDFLASPQDCWPSQYTVTLDGYIPVLGSDPQQTLVAANLTKKIQDPPGASLPEHGTVLPLDTVRKLQQAYYPDEFAGKPTSLAKTMGLFLGEDGCLHCKGRFRYAELTESQKTPILLPKASRVTVQLILRIHELNHHVGVTHTLSLLRQDYWVPHGRALVKSVLATCKPCIKYGGGPYQLPPMPHLPEHRVSYSAPFSFTGLDYLGPLTIKANGGSQKRWICLFTCMAVRAVHLEVVGDMSAEEFTLALRRFAAARVSPSLIISDNASQFKATASVLQSASVQWKFIPELSPWQGGFYERLVGLIKHCLRRSLDRSLLTDSQLLTVVKEIESVLNTRPLTTVGDDIEHILTPADFLKPVGPPLLEPPLTHQTTSTIQSGLVQAWKRNQKMLGEFRRMFVNQYLLSLRERLQFQHKQQRVVSHSTPHVGAVVLIKGDSSNRAHWAVARVTALIPSRDGLVRSARVLLPTGRELTRSIGHLFPLEIPATATRASEPQAPPTQQQLEQTPNSAAAPSMVSQPRLPTPASPDVDGHDQAAPTDDGRPQRASAALARRRIRAWTRSLFVAAVDAI